MDGASLARKKALRGTQRAAVTRFVTKATELLREDTNDPEIVAQLDLKKTQLKEKSEVIKTLDAEILEATPEEDLEAEVESADATQERITLAVMRINRFIAQRPQTAIEPPTGVTGSTLTAEAPPSDTPDGQPPTDSGHSLSTSDPHSEDTHMHTPLTSMHTPLTDSADSSSIPNLDNGSSPMHTLRTPTHTLAAPRIRLPEITLSKFDGNLTKWSSFWDVFESSVHKNSTLTDIEKFIYLRSLLESTAADSISGLTLSAANYKEAVAVLQRRFGNKRFIIGKHLDSLWNLETITSANNTKSLRRLYDTVESHVRGLQALGVSPASYGELLMSILMNKLPQELCLLISRKLAEDDWTLDTILDIFENEVIARERAAVTVSNHSTRKVSFKTPLSERHLPTLNSFMTSNQVSCVYCSQPHSSSSCRAVSTAGDRKRILVRSGRCFICLRKGHISKDCRSNTKCETCSGRHHHSICMPSTRKAMDPDKTTPSKLTTQMHTHHTPMHTPAPSSTTVTYTCVNSQTTILLQTARIQIGNPSTEQPSMEARLILDSGSQRTYVTKQVQETLSLKPIRTETVIIKTFGSKLGNQRTCDVVEFSIKAKDGAMIYVTALVVPVVCDPVCHQPVSLTQTTYDYLSGLDLADSSTSGSDLDIDVLLGSDYYWTVVTGRVLRNQDGPTAIHTRLGWILSGPTGPIDVMDQTDTFVNLISSHTLLSSTTQELGPQTDLDTGLKKFWDLESMGILKEEPSVYEVFKQRITFKDQRYVVNLPWKESHPGLPTNLELCQRRLQGLLRRLRQDPKLLEEYHKIIQDQLKKGIVEVVPPTKQEKEHYLPHHPVIRQDKTTSKVRIVYDASTKVQGPSLNDCLYAGPPFNQSIFDIILRFRCHSIALIGDIEKAFLMVGIAEEDRDSLRFLWVKDPNTEPVELVKLRFTRVVFGVTSSPFLLNATIDTHIKKLLEVEPVFVDKFLRSMYVDDLTVSLSDIDSAYEFYVKAKARLSEAGFKLRKFMTNSPKLHERLNIEDTGNMRNDHKVLGVQWNPTNDVLIFDITYIVKEMEKTTPTKRGIVGIATKFFDPLGMLSPIIICFKILFQSLCEAKLSWDDELPEELLTHWTRLLKGLQEFEPIEIPRSLGNGATIHGCSLHGFCDASSKAYAAVIYLIVETEVGKWTKLLCSKTRVAPIKTVTIPRLELLSALLLSRLVNTVTLALSSELTLNDSFCYTDSKIALCWIQQKGKEWKQFVQNRVIEIRSLTSGSHWKHCPGNENPADIPSRGVDVREFHERSDLWFHGPSWLAEEDYDVCENDKEIVSEECLVELKKSHTSLLVSTNTEFLVDCSKFSSLGDLVRVMSFVYMFIRVLRSLPQVRRITADDRTNAMSYLLRVSQSNLEHSSKFALWKKQFCIYKGVDGLWRSKGRLGHSQLPAATVDPIFLDKTHPLTSLIVKDCHGRVLHSGVRSTLTELRSKYWLVQARQLIKKFIHQCTVCRRAEGQPYKGPPAPPLPSFRVSEVPAFTYTGLDFAGPLYIRDRALSGQHKVWLCLFTCCVVRAVHLDLVPDMTAESFLRCFRRFTSRRGFPVKLLSDNAKTFKSAEHEITSILNNPIVQRHFVDMSIEWRFNIERAPWWGGVFERMIQSTKRCIRKTVGKARLTYDELSTVLAEVEMILNSRPLSYMESDDLEQPLTPSHLIMGRRVMNLPSVESGDSFEDEFKITKEELHDRMKHLTVSLNHFWKRWRNEYLIELRDAHRHSPITRNQSRRINKGDVVLIHDEELPRGQWRLGVVESLFKGIDGLVRAASVRTHSPGGQVTTLRRPIQKLYPLEVTTTSREEPTDEYSIADRPESNTSVLPTPRPQRRAAREARSWIRGLADD